MPTGSLCAERNVIGSALAADLALRREDIRYVAVLSLSLEPDPPLLCDECGNDEENEYEDIVSPLVLHALTPQTSIASAPSNSIEELPARPADMKRAMSQPIVSSHHHSQHHSQSGSSTPNKTKIINILDVPSSTLFTPNQPTEMRRQRESIRKQPDEVQYFERYLFSQYKSESKGPRKRILKIRNSTISSKSYCCRGEVS